MVTSVSLTCWSSRVRNVLKYGLSLVPSPGHLSSALSAFDVMSPAAIAARNSASAFVGSALLMRIASRARNEFANFAHCAVFPL